jgi:hypothetical protein
MKTSLPKLLKCKRVQAGGLLAVTAVIAASLAWSTEGRMKLGGSWVGKYGDISWTSTYSPDPSGQNATCTLQWMTVSAEFEALFALIGADHMSMVSGSLSMVNPDTAKGKLLWYILAEGKPSTTQPVAGQIKAVAVMSSEWRFTSSTTATGKHQLKIYFPDPQNPMAPKEAYLFFDQTYENVPHLRIF